jgi:hypothetical protein
VSDPVTSSYSGTILCGHVPVRPVGRDHADGCGICENGHIKQTWVRLERARSHSRIWRPIYSIPNSLASAFHFPSTSARVFASIAISSGHGRPNPSVDHLRVASMPIFEP